MTTEHLEIFKGLHQQQNRALVLNNIWDAAGAVILQQADAQALATGSASLAWANGYADGGQLPIDTLLSSVANICRVSRIPVSIDIEGGYSNDPQQVAELVEKLAELGGVGINLEDGSDEPGLLCEKISAIRQCVPSSTMFINARVDVYLRQLASGSDALEMTINRINQYQQAGADGAFVPGLADSQMIQSLVENIELPLNIMSAAPESELEELVKLGVKRISRGPHTMLSSYQSLLEYQGSTETLSFDWMQKATS